MLLAPKALLIGLLRAVLSVKSVFLLYLANLLFAAVVAVPVYHLAGDVLARTPDTRSFLVAFDAEFIADLFRNHADTFDGAAAAARVSAVFFVLVYLFLLGGVLTALADRRRPVTFTTFFAACGRHIFPFVRVLVPAGIVLAALMFANDLASNGLTRFFERTLDRSASAGLLGWTSTAKTVIFLCLFALLVVLPIQFARIRCVVDDDRRMLRGYLHGIGLCFRNPFTVLAYFVLSSGLVLLVLGGYDHLLRRVDWTAPFQPFAWFGADYDFTVSPDLLFQVLTQLAVFLVQALLVMRLAGLLVIYQERTAAPIPQDPDLAYADAPVVDAPRPRRRPGGYGLKDEGTSTTGGL